MFLINLLRRLISCTSGAAFIEGAIVIPVAIILMAGSVEFGRLFSAYGTAEKSMRNAARYLARVQPDQVCHWGLDNAKNLAVYGSPTNTGQPLIPGWTTGTVNAYWMPADVNVSGCPAPSSIIELRADVPYTGFMFTIGMFQWADLARETSGAFHSSVDCSEIAWAPHWSSSRLCSQCSC